MLNVVRIREKGGFRYAEITGTGDADHASWWSFDDEQEVRDRHWHPKPGEVVLDIGAAFGSYTLPALAAGARVIAFSPADFDTELLEKNLSLNPELAERCLVVRDGLHARDGWFNPDRSLFHGSTPGMGDLRVRALDAFLAERPGIDRVDWMKLDVEGAELGVLEGAQIAISTWHPKILVECHNFHDPQMEQKVIQSLKAFGYSCDGPYQHCQVSHAFFEVKR